MERHIGIEEDTKEDNMVKLRPDKMNLVEGYTASPTVFKNMGLYQDDRFENKEGVELKVVERNSREWSVEVVND